MKVRAACRQHDIPNILDFRLYFYHDLLLGVVKSLKVASVLIDEEGSDWISVVRLSGLMELVKV